MNNLPCKDCICLAICRSQANSIYDEIILGDLDSNYDAYAVMTIIENNLTGPLTNKCENITSYITKKDAESYINSIVYDKLLEIIKYLNSPLHDLYIGAREYADRMYQQYVDSKNKKIDKDIRYG